MREAIRMLAIVVCCLLALPTGVRAQRAPASNAEWDTLGGLDKGTRLHLETRDNEGSHEAEFVEQSETFIVLNDAVQGMRQYQRETIKTVWRFDPPRRGRNALLGFLIGAVAGAGITAVTAATGRDFAHPGAMGIIGGAVGAGIGTWTSSPPRVLLYRALWGQ